MVESLFVFVFVFFRKIAPPPFFCFVLFLIWGAKPMCTIKQVHELANMAYLGKAR